MSTFSRTSLTTNQSDQMIVDCFHDLLFFHVDGQFLSKLYDVFSPFDDVVSCRNGDIRMGDIFKTIRLIFVIGKLNFLNVLNYFQRFFPKCLETDLTAHQTIGFVGKFILVCHLLSLFVINDSLNSRLICVYCKDIHFGCNNLYLGLNLLILLLIISLFLQIFLQLLLLFDLFFVER